MKIKSYILVIPLFCVSGVAAAADDLSILIHGAAIHSDCTKGKGKKSKTCDFNNFNPGLGLAWAFWGDNDTGKLAVRGGAYKDSFSEMAVYGGLSYRKEWYFTEHAFAGLGFQAGYLNGSGLDGFAALPMVTLGYKSVALEVGYAPKLDFALGSKHVAVTTFSLRWTL